jgi:hypothetical protein
MAIGSEDGSASRNATLGTAGGNLAVADGDASEAESTFARAHELEADVPMPFEHAPVSLDDGRRLSAAENPPLHDSREPIGSSPNWGRPIRAGPARPSSWRCGSPLWPRVPPSFSCSAAPSWRWLDWSRGRTCNGTRNAR